MADAKAELKAVKSSPKATPKPTIAADKPISRAKSVVAKSAKPTISSKTKAKSVTKSK